MARRPLVIDESLRLLNATGDEQNVLPLGSADWYRWLADERNRSFSFKSSQGHFTARRERQRNTWYWYAYRKRNGKLHKLYLGKPEELTQARLEAVAHTLTHKTALTSDTLVQPEKGSQTPAFAVFAPLESLPLPGTELTEWPGERLPLPLASLIEQVASLLDKSLLQQIANEQHETSATKAFLLTTIQEYGQAILAKRGAIQDIQRAHATYYCSLAEEAELHSAGIQQTAWLTRLEQEYENLREALRWVTEQQEAELALRLSGALWWFWSVRGQLSEGRSWLGKALSIDRGGHAALRAKVLDRSGDLALHQRDYAYAEQQCQQSLSLYRQLADMRNSAATLWRLGLIAWSQHNLVLTRSYAQEALRLFEQIGDNGGRADSLLLLAYVATRQGIHEQARLLTERTLALFEAAEDRWGSAYALLHLGQVALAQKNESLATSYLEECITRSRELGYKGGLASALALLGTIALEQHDESRAFSFAQESLVLRKEIGDISGTIETLLLFAKITFSQQNYSATLALYEESAELLTSMNDHLLLTSWLREVSRVLSQYKRLPHITAHTTVEQAITVLRQARTSSQTPPSDGLTSRELDVLRLLAMGNTDAQIAERLVISPRTVNGHLASIYAKIGVSSRSAATRYAIHHHLL
ncbi:MAG: hypothetical protein NVSMB49_24240 [Ktedonobacteraceae bacterium]